MAITADPCGSWSERNIADIAECMDIAFAKVLADEFDWLTAGMSSAQVDNWLQRSEESILRLRNSGDMPDYSDPMVVLRYVILYQLGHINLAYTLVKDATATGDNRLTRTGRLQVADFGAGCLAMQFGLALAVADALESGEDIAGVWLDAIDTGRPMMELGKKLWEEFANEAGHYTGLNFLTEAAKLMHWSEFHEQYHSVRKFDGMDHWVSALHTLYDGSENAVGNALSGLCNTLAPTGVFVTCHEWKTDLARQVLPPGWHWGDGGQPQLRFEDSYIDNSRAASVAFDRGFQPSTWRNRRLYTDVSGAWAFIATPSAAGRRRRVAAEPRQAQREGAGRRRQQRATRAQDAQRSTAGAGASGGRGCLLPILGAAFLGVAGTLGAIWLGTSLLG